MSAFKHQQIKVRFPNGEVRTLTHDRVFPGKPTPKTDNNPLAANRHAHAIGRKKARTP